MDTAVTADIHYREGFTSPQPWPSLKITGPNPYYARLLMEDYAGPVSELTAAMQYIYHHTVLGARPEIATALEQIAIVEMMHMEKLATAIYKLGGDPRFQPAPQGDAWCAANIDYGSCLFEQLHQDLAGEYAAVQSYKAHIDMIQEPSIKALLRRIIADELLHIQHLKQMIANEER